MAGCCDDVEEYLASAPEEIRELAVGFRALKWGVEEIVAYVATATKQRSAAVESDFVSESIKDLERAKSDMGLGVDYEAVRKGGNHVTTINVELTEEQKQVVRSDLASFTTVEFRSTGRGTRVCHGVAHAFRTAMLIQVFRSIPKGARILEVGANVMSAIRRNVSIGSYYGLVPIISATDAVRWNQQMRALKVMVRRGGRDGLKDSQRLVAEKVLEDSSVMFADVKLQDFVGDIDYVVSIHSNWDIPIVDVVKSMHRIGASVYTMVLDRIPGLQFYNGQRKGFVAGLGVHWEADADNDVISFWFDHDSSFIYKHSFRNVRAYQSVAGSTFKCGGRTYMFKEASYSTPMQLVLVCVDLGRLDVKLESDVVYADSGKHGMVSLTVPARVMPTVEGARVSMTSLKFDVDETALCKALQDRMLKGASGSPETVMRYVRANRMTIVHNGVRVSVQNPVSVDQFRGFSVGVDALARDMLYASDKDAELVASTIVNGGRKFVGPMGVIMESVSNAMIGSGSLYQSIVLRMRELAARNLEGRVCVERCPRVLAIPRESVRDLDADVGFVFGKSCYCFERDEVLSMLAGDKGAITEKELYVLERYAFFLKNRECVRCLRVKSDVMQDFMHEEEEDEFFECCTTASQTHVDSVFDESSSSVVSDVMAEEDLEVTDDVDEIERKILQSVIGRADEDRDCDEPIAVMREAVDEYACILRKQMLAADSGTRDVVKLVGMAGSITQDGVSKFCNDREWHSLVNVGSFGRLDKPMNSLVGLDDFVRVFDYQQDKFFSVVKRRNGWYVPETCSSVVYTSYRYKVWNQPVILQRLGFLTQDEWLDKEAVTIPFVNGVAGCGKTTGIEKAYDCLDEKKKKKRLILTTFTESAKATREKLFGFSKVGKDFVRTYDSLIAWGTDYQFDEVVCDEMAALHPGQLFAILAMLKPKKMRGYGDFKQMEYCPFLGDYSPKFSSLLEFCDVEWMSHSHRLRTSILASCVNYYGTEAGLSRCGCCQHNSISDEGGIETRKINSLVEVPVDTSATYLTYTQKEKEDVRTMLIGAGWSLSDVESQCMTIGESQGITRDLVFVIRMNEKNKPDSLYHQKFRVNVGKTRSRLEVRYYTTSYEIDEMMKVAADSKCDALRRIIHDNTDAFIAKVKKAGGMDAYLEKFFLLKDI